VRRHWYLISHFECPVCGHDKVYLERVYVRPQNTHVFVVDYDYCLERER